MAEADARNGDNGGNAGNEAEPQEHTLQDYLTPMVGGKSSIVLPWLAI